MNDFRWVSFVLTIIAGSIILSAVALVNGYPLVFPDTGINLAQALEFRGAFSRPPYYSLFLLPIHLKISLWPVVFVQGAITAGVLYLVIRTIFPRKASLRYLLITCFLAIFTSLPWHTGQILPDLFTGILILTVYLIVFGWDDFGRWARLFIIFILFAATAFHYSHLLLLAVTGGVALLTAAWSQRSARKVLIPALLIVAAGLTTAAAFATYNYAYAGRATLSLDSSKFLLARMLADGTAMEFLRQTCPDKRFVLCDHLDEIRGDQNAFLWDGPTPWPYVEEARGFLGARDEAAAIVRGVLQKFPLEQAAKSLENFVTQLFKFGSGDTLCPCLGALTEEVIIRHFPNEHSSYIASRQNRNTLPIHFVRVVHSTVVAIAALGCIGFLLRIFPGQNKRRASDSKILQLTVVTVTGVLTNAMITGALSGPADRYQSRVVWLIVFNFLLIVLSSSRVKRARSQQAATASGVTLTDPIDGGE